MQERSRQQTEAEEPSATPERNRVPAGARGPADPARAERLRELRDAIREGRYAVSAEEVAQRILEDLKRER